jgi:acyl-CoA synthetase (AMP-forming)/AMP-acid ligase II
MAPTSDQELAVPDYIDQAAKEEPDAIWALVPYSSSLPDEQWHPLTYAQLARAVDRLAQSLESTLGVPVHKGQVIGYIG